MFLFYVLTTLVIYFVAYPEDTPKVIAKRLPKRFPWYLSYPLSIVAFMVKLLTELIWWTCILVYKTTNLLFRLLSGQLIQLELLGEKRRSHRRVRVNTLHYHSRRRSGRPTRRVDFARH